MKWTFTKLSSWKSWVNPAIFLLFLLAVCLGVAIPNRQTQEANEQAAIDLEARLVKEAEKLIKQLEKEPEQDKIAPAQVAVDRLTKKKNKDDFQKRLDAVKAELGARDEAERLIKQLEGDQTNDNVGQAQTAVDKVGDETIKATFQGRIDAVKSAIKSREEAAAKAAKAAASSSSVPSSSSSIPPSSSQEAYYYYYEEPAPTPVQPAPTVPGGTVPAAPSQPVTPAPQAPSEPSPPVETPAPASP